MGCPGRADMGAACRSVRGLDGADERASPGGRTDQTVVSFTIMSL